MGDEMAFNAEYIVTRTEGTSKSGAFLRSEMSAESPGVLLPFGTVLDLIVDTNTRWKLVRTKKGIEGFISDINLTKSPSFAVSRLLESAAYYWKIFGYGLGKEFKDPYHGYVVQMWKEVGKMPPKIGGTGAHKDRINTSHPDYPWSAVGISAIIRNAKGYKNFSYSTSHSTYIKQSINNNGIQDAPFWGFRLKDAPVRVGDLVCQWRERKQTYESAKSNAHFKSHTDIVCEIKKGYVIALGCNNSDSISLKRYSIDFQGNLLGSGGNLPGDKTVFMFMRNTCPF